MSISNLTVEYNSILSLFQAHEKRYPIEVDGQNSLRKVLLRNNCPTTPLSIGQEDELEDLFESHKPQSLLFEQDLDQGTQADQPYGHRGDIPMVTALDDGKYTN